MSGSLQKNLRIIFALFIFACSFGITLYGFVAPSSKKPSNPPHVLFTSTGGPVVFPHNHHQSDSGSAVACADCHHKANPAAKIDAAQMKCRTCHYSTADAMEKVCADEVMHPRCIGKHCLKCHDGEECTFCHRKVR